jgi:translation initiation factor IF-3
MSKVPRDQGPRVNDAIRVPEVRLIDHEGTQVGVVRTERALEMAEEHGLDLVEVAAGSKPPVCKIIDYGKYKYDKKKKEQEARKKQVVVEVKEVQFRPKTDQHDFEHKIKNAERFLDNGDKVKISVIFRGREIAHADVGRELIQRIEEALGDYGTVEAPAKMEGRRLTMVIAPLKKKKSKKGKQKEQEQAAAKKETSTEKSSAEKSS